MQDILIISRDERLGDLFREALGAEFAIIQVTQLETGLEQFQQRFFAYTFFEFALVQSGLREPGVAAFRERLQAFWRVHPTSYLVALSEKEALPQTVAVIQAGADDYLVLPLTQAEIMTTMTRIRASQHAAQLPQASDNFWKADVRAMVATHSAAMTKVYRAVRDVAATRSTVLLTGETGVGKSMVARLIHRHSKVSDGAFITLHCGAIAESLLESELFGHERGAFTGAIKQKLGRFELANGGSLFLDEIGTITPSAQIKLLQVIQEGTFQRVGGLNNLSANARLISATNEDLETLCQDGRFRRDLFYRLNVFPIHLPPLRERSEDIPMLVESFLERLNRTYEKRVKGLADGVQAALEAYHWPGNIRELENLVERAYILEHSPLLTLASFPAVISQQRGDGVFDLHAELTLAQARLALRESFERQYLQNQLRLKQGRIKETASAAGLSMRQMHRLMRKYGLDKRDFKRGKH